VSKESRDTLDELGLEIARAKWLEGRTFEELAREHPYSKAVLHRKFQAWQEAKRFEIVDTWDSASAARVERLEEDLAEELARKTLIWRARVARVVGADHAYTGEYRESPATRSAQSAFDASDALHRALGEVAAELLLNLFNPHMIVGLASGRAVGFAVARLEELEKRSPAWFTGYKSLRIVSLCGGTRVGRWGLATGRDFDADGNTYYLGEVLKVPLANRHYMHGWISRTSEPTPEVKLALDLALVGLGVLNTQHHFLRHSAEVQLGPMAEPLDMIRKCQRDDPDLVDSVLEIGHRVFPAGTRKSLPGELATAIDVINREIRAVPLEKIRDSRQTILIAGGAQKLAGLVRLITGECPEAPINVGNLTLITDSWTAREILARLKEKPTGPSLATADGKLRRR
jgi:DNA-binding transcriptional regulator LsrR (DeoR family)